MNHKKEQTIALKPYPHLASTHLNEIIGVSEIQRGASILA